MSRIHNTDTIKRILDDAKIQTSHDDVPSQLASKVVPVLISNPKNPAKIIILTDWNSNDTSKRWYVPVGKKWKILNGLIDFSSNATVGNRVITFEVEDYDGNYAWKINAGDQAASLNYLYNLISGAVYQQTVATSPSMPVPQGWILNGSSILIRESAGISATDDMFVYIVIEETELLSDEFELRDGADA